MPRFPVFAEHESENSTSDFLFSTRSGDSANLVRILTRYLAPVAPVIEGRDGEWGSLAVARGVHDDARFLVEDTTHLSVLVGDPIVRGGSFAPGLSRDARRRTYLHSLLDTDGDRWDDHLDGQYAILHVDKNTRRFLVITDRFAFIPLFTSIPVQHHRVVGTHVDAVACAAHCDHALDLVSLADVIGTLTCTPPYTVYSDVRQQPPATAVRVHLPGHETSVTFWQPDEKNDFASVRDAAATLRDAIIADAALTTAETGSAGILLSAGEDSRAVLAALDARIPVKAVTFAAWHSREARIAARIASAHGAEHCVGIRAVTHYTDGFCAVASMIGSHHMFVDVHGYGLHEKLGINPLPVVFGGLSSDSLLKGAYVTKPPTPAKAQPIEAVVRPDLCREAELRRTAFRRELDIMRPRSAHEWTHLWPFAMRKHGGNVDGNRRLFAIHEAYHSNAVLDVAAAVPVRWKQHRKLFHLAMKPLFEKTRFVPHGDYRFPAFGGGMNAMLLPLLAAARGVRAAAKGETRSRHRSWPTWGSIAGSPAASRLREKWSLHDSPIREVFGPQRADALDAEIERWYSLRRLALMQLVYLSRLPG